MCTLGEASNPLDMLKKFTPCYMGTRNTGGENSWEGDDGDWNTAACFPSTCGLQDKPCNGKGQCRRWEYGGNGLTALDWLSTKDSDISGCDCNQISSSERADYNFMCEKKANSVFKKTYLQQAWTSGSVPTGNVDTSGDDGLDGMGGEHPT